VVHDAALAAGKRTRDATGGQPTLPEVIMSRRQSQTENGSDEYPTKLAGRPRLIRGRNSNNDGLTLGANLIAGGGQMKLEGKVAVVTGASSGIGRAGALALAEAGADIVVNGHSQMQKAEEVAHQIEAMGRRAIAVRADVSKPADVDRLVTQTVDTMGKVDILFNNAGIIQVASLEEHSDEIWQRTINVNLTGHFLCCRRVVPEMKKLGKGKIINNGSIFGHQGVPRGQQNGHSRPDAMSGGRAGTL
jgi:short chain dehydrogenase